MRNSGTMNIQDVIARLSAIKEEHGNLPVVMFDYTLSGFQGPRMPYISLRDIDEKPVCVEITHGTKYKNQEAEDTQTAFLPENQL